MPEELISVAEIAKAHGTHKAQVFKLLQRLGIERRLLRSDEARGQKAAFISCQDYEKLKLEFDGDPWEDGDDSVAGDWVGFLYVIQLEPELDPGRFKIGFANSVDDRLRKHRTAAPFAAVLCSWPCKLLWEKTAIGSITHECERLHTEVFCTDDLDAVIRRAQAFFAIMPMLAQKDTSS